MDHSARIELALEGALHAASVHAPPRLAAALRYAVFPGGARVRPRLCLAVAAACGDADPRAADAAAAAVELMHCASLVHDDLPCFDDAQLRRGKPALHRAFGDALAVLVGDALIVLAFETMTRRLIEAPGHVAQAMLAISRGVGAPNGLVAGQAWESEPAIPRRIYQQAKTGSLFAASTAAGAAAAGADPERWFELGLCLGEAYQIADDIADVAGDVAVLGKPVGRDLALDRPNAATDLGLTAAADRLKELMAQALRSIPPCAAAWHVEALINDQVNRLMSDRGAQGVSASRAGAQVLRAAELVE